MAFKPPSGTRPPKIPHDVWDEKKPSVFTRLLSENLIVFFICLFHFPKGGHPKIVLFVCHRMLIFVELFFFLFGPGSRLARIVAERRW